jgi:DUF4097 and DUF4098 domain-containing protein YvlB
MGTLMTTFTTPTPIDVSVDFGNAADVRIVASDRADTTVQVSPQRPGRTADTRAADDTTVEFADGRLTVTLKKWLRYVSFTDGGAVDVLIEVPTGSSVDVHSGMGTLRCEGLLADVVLRSAMGGIHVDRAGTLRAKTAQGDVFIERVDGHAEVTSGSGEIRVNEFGSTAVVKNSNGVTVLGETNGAVQATASNGDITIDSPRADVTAKSSNGSVRIGDVHTGAVTVQTGYGSLDVAVREGTAAWLDLSVKYGRVYNELTGTDAPDTGGEPAGTAEVRARSSYGDITIHRSPK